MEYIEKYTKYIKEDELKNIPFVVTIQNSTTKKFLE